MHQIVLNIENARLIDFLMGSSPLLEGLVFPENSVRYVVAANGLGVKLTFTVNSETPSCAIDQFRVLLGKIRKLYGDGLLTVTIVGEMEEEVPLTLYHLYEHLDGIQKE